MGLAEMEGQEPLHPLISDRLYVSQRIGEILGDDARRDSPELDYWLREASKVSGQLREQQIDLSPYFEALAAIPRPQTFL